MDDIYLIRHGQASFGAENHDRLSEKGVRQAVVPGKHLAALNVKFDAIYSGRMERQQQTAEGVMPCEHLRKRRFHGRPTKRIFRSGPGPQRI